ncbi:DUF3291 domain-containing protein [Streptomyces sp. NPDC057702]|uniref:DUF3291 domain-containing protein n=1 Tax=unclassified Streptomyces TaxID=2593676 RepID=UPI00368571B2
MPTLPWITAATPDPATRAVVMASRLELRSRAQVPRFFWKSLLALRQARKAPGALGVTLVAEPLRGVFWTLSAWENEQAVHAYARAEPHRSIMRELGAVTRRSRFVFWTAPADTLPIDWAEARHRIAEAEAAAEAGA